MKILWIAFMARSGSTWLGKIFAAHPGVLFHCHFYENRLGRMSSKQVAAIEKKLRRLGKNRGHDHDVAPFFTQPARPELMVLKDSYASQHPALIGRYGKVICLIRDPRGQYNSLKNHARFGSNYRPGPSSERWANLNDYLLGLCDLDPDTYRLARYEDLASDPLTAVPELFEWVGLDYRPEVEEFLIDSHSRHELGPMAVFKDPKMAVNSWQYELSRVERDIIRETVGGTRAGLLYGIRKEKP